MLFSNFDVDCGNILSHLRMPLLDVHIVLKDFAVLVAKLSLVFSSENRAPCQSVVKQKYATVDAINRTAAKMHGFLLINIRYWFIPQTSIIHGLTCRGAAPNSTIHSKNENSMFVLITYSGKDEKFIFRRQAAKPWYGDFS